MANGNGNRNLPKVPTFTDKFRLPGFGGFGGFGGGGFGGFGGGFGGGGFGPGSNFLPESFNQGFGNFNIPNLPETPGGAYNPSAQPDTDPYVPPGGAEPPAQPPVTGGSTTDDVYKSDDDEDEGELAEVAPGGVDDDGTYKGEEEEEFPSEPWVPGGPVESEETPSEIDYGDGQTLEEASEGGAGGATYEGEEEEEDLAASGEGEDDPNAGVDEKFQGLLDDWEESWSAEGGTQSEILGQSAAAHRRIAEINAKLGRSVGGGFGGAYNEVTINTINELAKAKAQHAEGRRDLLLNWMEKSIDQDFSREMAAGEQAMAMVTALLQSGEAIDDETMDWLMGIAGGGRDWREEEVQDGIWTGSREDWEGREGDRGVFTGGMPNDPGTDTDGDGYSDAYEISTGSSPDSASDTPSEGAFMENESGDWYFGLDEDGNWAHGQPGMVTDDPYNDDSGEHQWFMVKQNASEFTTKEINGITFTGPDFYYEDEDGNQVMFQPGIDGGRWPGDTSMYYNPATKPTYSGGSGLEEGEVRMVGGGSEYSEHYYHSQTTNDSVSGLGIRQSLAELLPILFGSDITADAHEPEEGLFDDDDEDGFVGITFSNDAAKQRYRELVNTDGLYGEVAAFTLDYMEDHEGTKPSPEELQAHLKSTRMWIWS